MNKIILMSMFVIFFIVGCSNNFTEQEARDIIESISIDDEIPKVCRDLDNINYTTLNISREDFENLSCSRKVGWIRRECYPLECKVRNPPVCNSIYLIACYDPSVEYNKYIWK